FAPKADTHGWLAAIQGRLTSAEHVNTHKPASGAGVHGANPADLRWVNVAFSCRGLRELGVDVTTLPREFQATPEERAAALWEPNGGYSPAGEDWKSWTVGGAETEMDAVILLAAGSPSELQTLEREVTNTLATYNIA